jgi:3-methyladenine DNA glycosylase/8-oxoguanine DNA glycosylase
VQEAMRIGLGLTSRPTAKEMGPLAEDWRPLRGVAAHLWWTYYKSPASAKALRSLRRCLPKSSRH